MTLSKFCLSAASNLRCQGVPLLQKKILIVPPSLELIFTVALFFIKLRQGRVHLLLVAEGWLYFLLALFDLILHVDPAVRFSDGVVLDDFIGAASSVPIFFYTLYLWLLVRKHLVESLPQRFRDLTKYALLIFIPLITILNTIASFVGLHRASRHGRLSIGFAAPGSRDTWFFFTSLTLALLTAFQALTFCLTVYRLIMGLIFLRRVELDNSPSSTYLCRGIGWLAVGTKLGAIETVAGFALTPQNGAAVSRRILRFVSRAVLVISSVKGMDTVEDYSMLLPKSKPLPPIISEPLYDTFRRMSRTPSVKSPTLNAEVGTFSKEAAYPPLEPVMEQSKRLSYASIRSIRRPIKVTTKATPETKLPTTDLPSPPASPPANGPPIESMVSDSTESDVIEIKNVDKGKAVETRDIRSSRGSSNAEFASIYTISSIEHLRDLASQFPALPPPARLVPHRERSQRKLPNPWDRPNPTGNDVLQLRPSTNSDRMIQPTARMSIPRLYRPLPPIPDRSTLATPLPSLDQLERSTDEADLAALGLMLPSTAVSLEGGPVHDPAIYDTPPSRLLGETARPPPSSIPEDPSEVSPFSLGANYLETDEDAQTTPARRLSRLGRSSSMATEVLREGMEYAFMWNPRHSMDQSDSSHLSRVTDEIMRNRPRKRVGRVVESTPVPVDVSERVTSMEVEGVSFLRPLGQEADWKRGRNRSFRTTSSGSLYSVDE